MLVNCQEGKLNRKEDERVKSYLYQLLMISYKCNGVRDSIQCDVPESQNIKCFKFL